ncbi:hypothetical protein DFH06DRAFT_1128102 [Mycena polygramma]|nr:hypothetical protein DFH06DRAFT_1128102 [Mycena polygramma]
MSALHNCKELRGKKGSPWGPERGDKVVRREGPEAAQEITVVCVPDNDKGKDSDQQVVGKGKPNVGYEREKLEAGNGQDGALKDLDMRESSSTRKMRTSHAGSSAPSFPFRVPTLTQPGGSPDLERLAPSATFTDNATDSDSEGGVVRGNRWSGTHSMARCLAQTHPVLPKSEDAPSAVPLPAPIAPLSLSLRVNGGWRVTGDDRGVVSIIRRPVALAF